jgi:hypothetical protein
MTRKNSFFLIGMTSVLLAFAMIGCDQGTKVEYRDRVVGGNGGNTGGGLTSEQQDALQLAALVDNTQKEVTITRAINLTSPLTIAGDRTITVGSGITPNIANLSVGGEGPLFAGNATASGSGTLNLNANLTLAKGAKLIVASGSKVNIKKPVIEDGFETAGAGLLKVGEGAIVDIRGQTGLNVESSAKLHFAKGAVLAVPKASGVIVAEAPKVGETASIITIESGVKVVVPDATTPVLNSDDSDNAVITIETGAAAEIGGGVEVYVTDDNTTPDTVASGDDGVTPDKTATDSANKEATKITPAFDRAKNSGTYTIESFTGSTVTLKAADDGTSKAYSVKDEVQTLLKAVYEPNAPGSTDTFVSIETGKSAVAYDDAVSAAVLGLFHITIDASDSIKDSIEVKGSLPKEILDATSAINILVIDIGLPEGNTGIPTFEIPHKGLGTDESTSYGGVRLRVNKGAKLVLLADNSKYMTYGAGEGNSCDAGFFNNGCVEVMEDGHLRDGAYQGYPLGNNSTILNRLGSFLSVGPEPNTDDAKGSMAATYANYYSGYLIGKNGTAPNDPRIVWSGSQTDGFIQVAPAQLVLSAEVTVKKFTGLIYDVWFVNTGAIKAGLTVGSNGALIQNGELYKFYGQEDQTITLTENGFIQRSFLVGTMSEVDMATTAGTYAGSGYPGGSLVLTNNGDTDKAGSAVTPKNADLFSGIFGYRNWEQTSPALALVGQLPVGKLASLN